MIRPSSPLPFGRGLEVGLFLLDDYLLAVHDVQTLLSLVHALTREVVDSIVLNCFTIDFADAGLDTADEELDGIGNIRVFE